MRKLFILLILIIGSKALSAQNCVNDFLGTKTLYTKPNGKYTAAPTGYLPVFINHVNRHGARHLTKDVSTNFAYKLLAKADSANALTPIGKRLKQAVWTLNKVEKGNTKSISGEGRTELIGLGERMFAINKNVFKRHSNFNVTITKEIRTTQSADAFLMGLKAGLKDSVNMTGYVNDDTNLRFYDFSPVYKKFEEDGPWTKYIEELEKAVKLKDVDDAFTNSIFTNVFVQSVSSDDQKQFVADVFGLATIVYSVMKEAGKLGIQLSALDFKPFFTCDQIIALSKMDLADDYYKKGPGIDNNGIQVRIAAPLLVNFIKTSDEFIKSGTFNAQLRFAHAETISPIAALMGISTADKASTDITHFGEAWQASKVIPLSSNVQWIFYKKAGSNKYLVKILLNEKESHITGLENKGSVYYDWSKLREFYVKKLAKMNVNLDDDMKTYLVNLK